MPRKRSSRRSRPGVTTAACTAGAFSADCAAGARSAACTPGDLSGACIPGDLSALMDFAESRPGLDSLNPVCVGTGVVPALFSTQEDVDAREQRTRSAPLPLVGRGWGWGSMLGTRLVHHCTTPTRLAALATLPTRGRVGLSLRRRAVISTRTRWSHEFYLHNMGNCG